jgi:hypothetical protein
MLTMQKLAIGRIIGLVIATAGIGMSIYCVMASIRLNEEVHQWITARPIETVVDFSQSSEVTTSFHHTCTSSHGVAIYFECDLDDETKQNMEEFFKDLSVKMVVTDMDGKEVKSFGIDGKRAYYVNGQIILSGFPSFRKGDYMITISVESGVAALANKEQSIHVAYQLCGLESMVVGISAAFAVGAGLIGLIASCCALPGLIRYGFRRKVVVESS